MHKILVGFLIATSYSFGMELQEPKTLSPMDPALVPTYRECSDELKDKQSSWHTTSKSDDALVLSFARHGDLILFNKVEYAFQDGSSNDNELFSWAVPKCKQDITNALLERGVLKSVGSRLIHGYIMKALETFQEDIAINILQAHPGFKLDQDKYHNYTPLQIAATCGLHRFAKVALEGDHGVTVDGNTEYVKSTPLQLCANSTGSQGSIQFCEPYRSDRRRAMMCLLLQHGAKHDFEVTTRHECGLYSKPSESKSSFVDWLASHNNHDCLAQLVNDRKLSGNSDVTTMWRNTESLRRWAASCGSLPVIQAIIPPSAKCSYGKFDVSDMLDCANIQCHHADNSKKIEAAHDVIAYLATHPAIQKKKSTAQMLLRTAANHGWGITLQKLVNHYGARLLTDTDDYYNPMALVADAAHLATPYMVKRLIGLGCDVHQVDARGTSPLTISVSSKSQESMEELLRAGAGTPEEVYDALKTAFNSYQDFSPRIFEQLLAYSPDKAKVTAVCAKHTDKTPVEFGAYKGYSMLEVMLKAGYDPNDYKKRTPLQIAIGRNDCKSISLLLQHGADQEVLWPEGLTALHAAAVEGTPETLRLLIDSGLTSVAHENGITPLMFAVARNCPESIAVLLDECNFNVATDILHSPKAGEHDLATDHTLFEFAVYQGCRLSPTYDLLYERGADIERVNELGDTPLMSAVKVGNMKAIEWLVSHGARLDVVNKAGQMVFDILAKSERDQEWFLLTLLKGLSNCSADSTHAKDLVSIDDALEHQKKFSLSYVADAKIAEWKKSLKGDPFGCARKICARGDATQYASNNPILQKLLYIERSLGAHGGYMFSEKMREVLSGKNPDQIKQFISTYQDLASYDIGHGATLLHWAAEKGQAQLLDQLLLKPGFKELINNETIHKCSALAEATTVECAQILLDNGARVTENVLLKLTRSKNREVCQLVLNYLLSHYTQVDELAALDVQNFYEHSVRYENVAFVDFCIKYGAKHSAKDILSAVQQENHELVALLKSHGISLSAACANPECIRYYEVKNGAEFAVSKKNLLLLKEVIETADGGALKKAASLGWIDGVEYILEHRADQCADSLSHALDKALESESTKCVELLTRTPIISYKHLERALKKQEHFALLLSRCKLSPEAVHALIKSALKLRAAGAVRLLAPYANSLKRLDASKPTYSHYIASFAALFGAHNNQRPSAPWKNRVVNITWLQAWKQRELEGFEIEFPNELPTQDVQDAIATLHAYMTAPVYANAEEHKSVLFWLLHKKVEIEDKNASRWCKPGPQTPYEYAQDLGNSSTFNDLLDPRKFEQWHAAIDTAYAHKK